MVLKKHLKKTAAAALALLLAFSALPGETVLGNEIPETEIAEVNAISDPTGISEQTEISEQTDVSESEEAAAGVTVMFYDIGSDLEGNNMSSTNDLLEIMEGIYSSGIENPKVNFIVETGGMDPNFKNRNRAQVISEGREDLESTYRDFDEEKLQRYRTRYDYLTGTGTDGAGIKWNENQRFEIYPDELKPAKQQPSDPGRSMTASDDNNAVPELAEFIKTTKEDYPADQYMLIMWDHGGGPSDGFGIDERVEGMIKAWSIPATMDEAGVDGNSAFALVNYDACLMGNLETALVWSPYTRYYAGSEELEGGDGDYYEPWVKLLCQDAEQVDFSDGNAADQEFEEIGKEIVKDFRNWYENREDTGTKSLIRTDKVPAVAEALSDFAKSCSRLFELDPLTSYNGIQQMRNISQDFYGRETGIIDISDFAYNMSSDKFTDIIDTGNMEMKAATDKMKSAGSALMKAVDQAVLLHQETSQYDLYHIGGITVYFPYMHANDFLKEYTDGYNGLEQTQSLQPYRDFLGSFASIQAAGADIWKNETEKAQVEKAFSDALDSYGLSGLYKGALKKVPSEIMDHRLQNESMKIYKEETDEGNSYFYKRRDFTLVHYVYQEPSVIFTQDKDKTEHFLGSLPAGKYEQTGDAWTQELINYDRQRWYGFSDGNGKYIPAALYEIDSGYTDDQKLCPGDPFTDQTYVQIPVLYQGDLHFLDVKFEKDSDYGTILGMWPFETESRVYGRYINASGFKGKEITILADVPNYLAGQAGVAFDPKKMAESALGTITVNQNTRLIRGISLCDENEGELAVDGTMSMGYYMKDLFGSYYSFEDFNETVTVSLKAGVNKKAKGSVMTKDDMSLSFTSENNTEYEDSELENLSYYYKDEDGGLRELYEIDGSFYTKEGDNENKAGEETPGLLYGTADIPEGYKEFILDKDTEIFIRPEEIDAKNLNKLDGGTVDLEKYFTLTGGVTSATIKVADTPGEESAQITDKSKNGAKKALVGEIDPVTYTGMSIITTQSKGKGSKMIDLTLYSEDGKTRLQEGTHYKVSYRNNKNAADMKDRKAPTLIITGKGDYAGMKYEAVFTIRKASLNDATLSFDRSYAPLSSKGITLKTTATLPSGVKVPANQIRLHYFGTDGAERTTAQLAEAFKGNEVLQLTVAAEAVENSRNYEGISWEFPLNDVINAYPKSKGSLSVSLKNNRISAGERKSAYDFLCEQFKTAKMGKTVFALEDIQYHGLYADTKFMKPYEFGTLTTSGTCYLAVSLNPVKQKEYGNYKTVPVKVIVTKPEYEEIFFDEYWTYGDKAKITGGIARLYKTKAKKKKNLTVCINAGHGTKGGEKVKTLCHPDGSPKIVSGSTAAGATEALAIVPQGVTMSTGEVEAKATLKASLAVKDALLKEGYNVLMIRETDDVQLDNIARTLIANNNANAHIAIHYDSTAKDKGVFFCSVPEVESYLNMEPVKSHWKEHEKLGQSLVDGLESAGFKKWNSGALDMDLTQTSYSTVPSVDLEIGDTVSDYSDETLAKVAKGITAGVNTFFGK